VVPRALSFVTETGIEADGFVTGAHRVDSTHPDLVDALADLRGWVTVAGVRSASA
jgi:hypothetical protein